MNLKEQIKILEIFKNSSIAEIEIGDANNHLRIKRQSQQVQLIPQKSASTPTQNPTAETEQPTKPEYVIKSNTVGYIHISHAQNEEPFIKVGDEIKKGDTIAYTESIGIKKPLKSDKDGTLKQILISNNDAIEYDQTLFILE